MIEKRKVVLVGTGFVGMSMAYSLLNQGGINELVLIDVLKDKAVGEAMDLSHGVPCAPAKIDIKAGDYDECKDADIVVVACGIPKLLKKEMIKEGSVVIDVGISRVDGKIVGDIDFDNIKDIALFVTPNPGGIGPMTIAMIIDNLIEMGEVNE